MSEPAISVVVPVFNEAGSLERLAGEVREAMGRTGQSWEIVFVDDASTDGSPDVLRRLSRREPNVRVLRHRNNAGQSAALASGFRAARGEVLVTLDADLQNDPADIPALLAALGDCDVVSGRRVDRQDTWLRRTSSRIANRVRRAVTGDSLTDIGCALKAFRAAQVRPIPLFTGMHRFLPALVEMRGGRVREVPVRHRPRLHGESKYGVRNRAWRALVDLLAVQWMRSRWIDPDNARELPAPGRDGERDAESTLVGDAPRERSRPVGSR